MFKHENKINIEHLDIMHVDGRTEAAWYRVIDFITPSTIVVDKNDNILLRIIGKTVTAEEIQSVINLYIKNDELNMLDLEVLI